MMPCQPFVADNILVLRLREGDATAFRLLFDRYHAKLLLFSARIVKSEAVAEEIVQDVFVKVWEGRQALNPDFSFQAYIYRIAKNRLLNHLRRLSYEQALKKDWPHLTVSQRNCNENQLLEADYAQLLHRAIGQLPPQRQRIYRMSREDELSYEEIAGSLGLSRHTVKAQMVKALDYLRRYVQVRAGIPVAVHLWGLWFCGLLP